MHLALFNFINIPLFINITSTTEIYTLSLHDALPIFMPRRDIVVMGASAGGIEILHTILSSFPWDFQASVFIVVHTTEDRKSTRLNSSHTVISYAVFCLKKKKKNKNRYRYRNNEHVCT